MCGRFSLRADPATLATELGAVDETSLGPVPVRLPDFDIPPTRAIAVLVRSGAYGTAGASGTGVAGASGTDEPARRLWSLRWGLVPPWAQTVDTMPVLFNARGETAAEKPSFRDAVRRRRCLVPMDGWYEWVLGPGEKRKQPYFLAPADGGRLYMAGLWSVWRDRADPVAPPVLGCAIVTTAAVGELGRVHDRMPRIVPVADHERWLDPSEPAVSDLLGPVSADVVAGIEIRAGGHAVGSAWSNGPRITEPLGLF